MYIKILTCEEACETIKNVDNITYSKEFFDFQEKRYGLKSGFLELYENNSIIALLPINYSDTALFSVFKDYTEPLILNQGLSEKISWGSLAKQIKSKLGYKIVEFNFAFINNEEISALSFKQTPLSTFVLKLGENENKKTIFEKFDKKTRNEVRKSEKYNFEIKLLNQSSIDDIYKLYKENMTRHGTPLKTIDFFNNVFECYKNKCFILGAFENSKLIGINFSLIYNNYLKLLFNFSKTEYWPMCVNNFLYYKTIELGYGKNIKIFDFGPSLSKDYSHNKFKINFGAEQIPILKLSIGPIWKPLQDWINRKKHSLKLRFNKLKSS